jgi:hypothetical protein
MVFDKDDFDSNFDTDFFFFRCFFLWNVLDFFDSLMGKSQWSYHRRHRLHRLGFWMIFFGYQKEMVFYYSILIKFRLD